MKTGAALRPFPICGDPELLSLLELGNLLDMVVRMLFGREDKEGNMIHQGKKPLLLLRGPVIGKKR
jgi:hypothetical protein